MAKMKIAIKGFAYMRMPRRMKKALRTWINYHPITAKQERMVDRFLLVAERNGNGK